MAKAALDFAKGDWVTISDDTGFIPAGLYQFEGRSGPLLYFRSDDAAIGILRDFVRYCRKVDHYSPPELNIELAHDYCTSLSPDFEFI